MSSDAFDEERPVGADGAEPEASEPEAAEPETPEAEGQATEAAVPEAQATTPDAGEPESAEGVEPKAAASVEPDPQVELVPPDAPTQAPVPPIVLSPPSIFRDRELTPVEATRLAVSSAQPKPWEPTDTDLDPTSDQGWQAAASHELIAIRPEDVVSPPLPTAGATGADGTAASAPPAQVDPGTHALPIRDPNAPSQRYVAPATSALAWAKGGSANAAGATSAAGSAAAAQPAPHAMPAFAPLPATSTSPLLTPIPNPAELTTAGAAAGATGATAGVAPTDAARPARSWPWKGAGARAKAGARTTARPMMLFVLFVLGVVLGSTYWARSQPQPRAAEPPPVTATGTTDNVPPQIQSLIAALAADNQSQIQLVVPAEPYRLLAGELAVDGITRILGARAMSTYANGPDSATEILVTGDDGQGNGLTFNLVVHLHNGVITDFR
jgi:hypothetical protein